MSQTTEQTIRETIQGLTADELEFLFPPGEPDLHLYKPEVMSAEEMVAEWEATAPEVGE